MDVLQLVVTLWSRTEFGPMGGGSLLGAAVVLVPFSVWYWRNRHRSFR